MRGAAALLAGALLVALGGCSSKEPSPEPAAGDGGPSYVTRGPAELDPVAVGIGREVPDFQLVDLAGEKGSLAGLLQGSKGLVVVFTTLGCPVCKNYHPSLEALAKRCEEQGLKFLAVDPSIADGAEELLAKVERMKWTFRLAQDPDYAITDALGATRTTDTFVIDATGALRYRGAWDDQYGINYRLPEPRHTYLLDAVQAVAAGERVPVRATTAPGCKLSRVKLPPH